MPRTGLDTGSPYIFFRGLTAVSYSAATNYLGLACADALSSRPCREGGQTIRERVHPRRRSNSPLPHFPLRAKPKGVGWMGCGDPDFVRRVALDG
jgi:hypothetical protein